MNTILDVVVGLVTEVRPDAIKASYRFLDENHQTDWVTIASGASESKRVEFLTPGVDDEVLLAFDQGDPRLPYVIGFLWTGKDKPPPSSNVRDRCITSRKGQVINFLGVPPSGRSVGALIIQDGHGNRIVMSNGKITIQSAGVLALEAPIVTIKGRPVVDRPGPI